MDIVPFLGKAQNLPNKGYGNVQSPKQGQSKLAEVEHQVQHNLSDVSTKIYHIRPLST